ncbi:hypothetical protein OF83DRAFT_73145 [Amylostereum chailletii]|nr:hypothetical protein OF83DRAFT_73145 [Amylostereum chailletii]
MSSIPSYVPPPPPLPADSVARATSAARRDGIFAGTTAGLLGAILATRMGLNRNRTLLAAVATGVLAGYNFTQGFLASNLSQLRAEATAFNDFRARNGTRGDDDTGAPSGA